MGSSVFVTFVNDVFDYGKSHAGERTGQATLGAAVACRRDLACIGHDVIESCVDAGKILSDSLGGSSQSFVCEGSGGVSYGSKVESVQ